jgi:predicted  nucleic acid-binding Zn-ribbon protein
MAISRQLYELQELDNDIENTRQTLDIKNHQLGNQEVLDKAAGLLAAEQKNLEELKHQRRDAEAAVSDILSKIAETNKQLYGGRVTNPKELGNLQHEANALTAQKDDLETKTLEIIERMEATDKKTAALVTDYQKLETEWKTEQEQLVKDIEILNKALAGLMEDRKERTTRIDATSLTLYDRIRKQKKQAVAKVEQGICKACRLSLSASALQRARGGQPVQCGTCGRILFIS